MLYFLRLAIIIGIKTFAIAGEAYEKERFEVFVLELIQGLLRYSEVLERDGQYVVWMNFIWKKFIRNGAVILAPVHISGGGIKRPQEWTEGRQNVWF